MCDCELCKLSRIFSEIAKKCTKEEVEALNEVWGRMECAETDLEYLKYKQQNKKGQKWN